LKTPAATQIARGGRALSISSRPDGISSHGRRQNHGVNHGVRGKFAKSGEGRKDACAGERRGHGKGRHSGGDRGDVYEDA